MNPRDFMVLDTASLYFRAYFALPASITDAAGRPTNAIRGLADFVATLARTYEPSHLIAAWDCDWRPGWRVAKVPTYKTHRLADPAEAELPVETEPASRTLERVTSWGSDTDEEAPDELEQQVPRIVEMLRLAGIPILGCPSHEADDVIGTLAATAPMPGYVVTGDRDLFQVIDDARGVRVVYLTRGIGNHALLDAAALVERYGARPEQYADFALLRGDSSDGLPGVAGIGEKTAAAVLQRFGDLDGLLAAASDPASGLTAGQRAKLLAGADYARAAAPVVQVVRDLANPFGWDDLRLGAGAAATEWQDFADRTNLGGAADRLRSALAPLRA